MIAVSCGHSDAGDDPRRADRARTDPDLDRVGAGIDQRLGGIGGRDIARDHLNGVRDALHPLDRRRDVEIVAVCGVDDDAVAARLDQRLGAGKAGVPDGGRGGNPQAPFGVLGRERRRHRFLDVLDGYQANQVIALVNHQQLLDPPFVEDAAGDLLARAKAHRRKIVMGHQLADRLTGVLREANVTVGEDPAQPAGLVDDRGCR